MPTSLSWLALLTVAAVALSLGLAWVRRRVARAQRASPPAPGTAPANNPAHPAPVSTAPAPARPARRATDVRASTPAPAPADLAQVAIRQAQASSRPAPPAKANDDWESF